MGKKIFMPILALLASLTSVIFIVSCGGTSGGDKDFTGTQFVAGESLGRIFFKTIPESIQTSRTAPFLVDVRDSNNAPIPAMQIFCDTEQGLALIEPTSGREITDSFGSVSGTIGCERPGSYQIGCRLPIGANKRVFATVKCSGQIPDGFVGFPGAGGGGLGGGQQISDDGGPGGTNIDGFELVGFALKDGDVENTFSVDTTQVNNCGSEGDDSEPFGDAVFNVTFVNETNSTISCGAYSITVPGVGEFGPISLGTSVAGGLAPNGGQGAASILLAAAQGDGTKTWAGSNTTIASSTGFKNITLDFACTKDTGSSSGVGESFVLSKSTGINFSNVNRCAEGGGGTGNTGGALVAVSLAFADNGVAGTSADVTDSNGSCGAGEVETIGDTTFTLTVNNNTGGSVSTSSYTVTVDGIGSAATQNKTALIASGNNQTFTGIIALSTGTAKTTLGGNTIGEVGLKNVTVTVNGVDATSSAVSVTASSAINFIEINNCQ